MNRTVKAIGLFLLAGVLAAMYLAPLESLNMPAFLAEGMRMLQTFAQRHLLYALLPAIALAAVVSVSISKTGVIRLMSARAGRAVAYTVAAGSGAILSVCSCSVLPLFAGIRRMGAGIGPACTFLYAGPAINVLAIVLTARVLGWQLGLARGVGAVLLGVVIGAIMSAMFGRAEEAERNAQPADVPATAGEESSPPLKRVGAVLAVMIVITVFLTWSPSGFSGMLRCCPGGLTATQIDGELLGQSGDRIVYRGHDGRERSVETQLVEGVQVESLLNQRIYQNRFALAGLTGAVLVTMVAVWFRRPEVSQWGQEGFFLLRKILLPLLIGVFLSGVLLGSSPGGGLIPREWIARTISGNGIGVNFMSAVAGAFMYFATLTEVPVVQGLMNSGMGRGPALAMLLAGPAVSLPSMLVLVSLMGWRKTAAYISLVVASATVAGVAFGAVCG